MNCKTFQESLDCYVDGELSPAAAAAADAHRHSCDMCHVATQNLLALRAALKQTSGAIPVPADLERRVQAPTLRWRPFGIPASRVAAAAAAVAAVGVLTAALARPPLDIRTADTLDRLAVRLDEASQVVVHGTLLCRDCELEHRYGIKSSCSQIGHHGAIFTADGRILNFVEQRASSALIHDESLYGRTVTVRGRLVRGARALVVDSYTLEG